MNELDIFSAALEIESPEQRASYLREACGDDQKLRERIEALLRSSKKAGSFIDAPAPGLMATLDQRAAAESDGATIGPYKLLQEIGEGGMGVVYMAEQTEPVKRRVALKIIKPRMDSRQIIARFEAERQALAMMDHPNLARVLDAGTTDHGRPFFVMELVKGVPITAYCDENHLTTRQRLELFAAVCHAVQHAHHKGIIHRDLKPSNVLVAEYDDRAVPKIIDFGVAKALNQSLTDKTMFTQFGQIVGTLEYMSPEQAKFNQLDVDTRSDVYSLGVLLYELLTGTTPFDRERLQSTSLDELIRIIGEEEPPKPSTRLHVSSTLPALAANRSADPRKLAGLVRGELDWITMRALEKDRTRRYETASALAADVERYLNDEPVHACPPSTLYRLKKLLSRNRTVLSRTAAAALICILASVAVAFGWKYYRGNVQRRAERRVREEDIPEIRRLVEQKQFVAAFMLAQEAERVLPGDAALAELRGEFAHDWTVQTYPEGADVYWRDYDNPQADWQYAGRTPIASINLPRVMLLWKVSREGFETVTACRHPDDDQVAFTLDKVGELPPGMVRVSGNAFRSNLYGLRLDDIEINDFFIDRCEVTNREYEKFVDAKGYETKSYWEAEFVKDGEVLSWDEVVPHLLDATGRPGPSTWRNGTFPEGEGGFPVRGVSWYEAAAYARFAGKELPTVAHWLLASGATRRHAITIAQQSNMESSGPVAVASKHGIGPYGTSDMAGNVREWCFNEANPGRRTMLGASWNEPAYRFGGWDQAEPLWRHPTHGFRCIKRSTRPLPEAALAAIPYFASRNLMNESPIDDEMFELIRDIYVDRSNSKDLDAQLVHRAEQHDAIHEVVEINAAYGRERFAIHLFLPSDGEPPYQSVLFFPGVGKFEREQPFPSDFSSARWMNPRFIVTGGRALVWPVYDGSFERFGSYRRDREWTVHAFRDLARAIDYLETRHDIDTGRIAFLGTSLGARLGPIFASLESRIRTSILYHGGILDVPVARQEDTLNFAPRVRNPTLMVNGRDDPVFNVKTSQEPLYHFLGSPPEMKVHLLFEGGHGTDARQWNPDALAWLDQHLGPVGTQDQRARLVSRANFGAARGQWHEAAADYVKATTIKPAESSENRDASIWMCAAVALLMAGDETGYRQLCERMIAQFAEKNEPEIQGPLLTTCLLRPGAVDPSTLPLEQFVRAIDDENTDARGPWPHVTGGLVALRQGEPNEALRRTRRALQEPLANAHPARALSHVIAALALTKLEQPAAARDEMAKASESIDRTLPKREDGRVDSRFVMRSQSLRVPWLMAELLRREAEGLLE